MHFLCLRKCFPLEDQIMQEVSSLLKIFILTILLEQQEANLPLRFTGVHEAVIKQQQPISLYLDPVIWEGFQQLFDGAESLDVNAAASQDCVIYNERSQAKPPHSVIMPHTHTHTHRHRVRSVPLKMTNDKHQAGRAGALLASSLSSSHLVASALSLYSSPSCIRGSVFDPLLLCSAQRLHCQVGYFFPGTDGFM